jgi:hypothetical protein
MCTSYLKMTFYRLMLNLPPKNEVVFSHQFYSTITHPLHYFSVSYHASPWFNSLTNAPGKSSFCYLRRSCVSPDQCIKLSHNLLPPEPFQCLSSNNFFFCLLSVSGYHIIQPGNLYYPLFTSNLSWHCRYFLEEFFFLYRWWNETVSVWLPLLM